MKVKNKHNQTANVSGTTQSRSDSGKNMQFDLLTDADYQTWRAKKLANYPASPNDILVTINNFNLLTENELIQIRTCLAKFNMVIYSLNTPRQIDASELCQFAEYFGLSRIDGNLCSGELNVSTVTVTEHQGKKTYIPYTNKPISWHTDGYYNLPEQTIRSFVLHCNQSAHSGGENVLFDPEIIYILLRDENPDYIRALMQENVLTIPENVENGIMVRAGQSGPVFSNDSVTGKLHMRYTARTRSVQWLKAPIVQQAVAAIAAILKFNTLYSFKFKLQTGQGLLCNNVLHNRCAFEDITETNANGEALTGKRELLRARYYDAISSI